MAGQETNLEDISKKNDVIRNKIKGVAEKLHRDKHVLNIVLFGLPGVGKSCTIHSFLQAYQNKPINFSKTTTDFNYIDLANGTNSKECRIRIWDTKGLPANISKTSDSGRVVQQILDGEFEPATNMDTPRLMCLPKDDWKIHCVVFVASAQQDVGSFNRNLTLFSFLKKQCAKKDIPMLIAETRLDLVQKSPSKGKHSEILAEKITLFVESFPLANYDDKSFENDAVRDLLLLSLLKRCIVSADTYYAMLESKKSYGNAQKVLADLFKEVFRTKIFSSQSDENSSKTVEKKPKPPKTPKSTISINNSDKKLRTLSDTISSQNITSPTTATSSTSNTSVSVSKTETIKSSTVGAKWPKDCQIPIILVENYSHFLEVKDLLPDLLKNAESSKFVRGDFSLDVQIDNRLVIVIGQGFNERLQLVDPNDRADYAKFLDKLRRRTSQIIFILYLHEKSTEIIQGKDLYYPQLWTNIKHSPIFSELHNEGRFISINKSLTEYQKETIMKRVYEYWENENAEIPDEEYWKSELECTVM